MFYQVVMRERQLFLDARNNPVNGYRVTFEMADGSVDWVDVSENMYLDPEFVKAKIEEKIEAHDKIATTFGGAV